jgi:hypothetical protein
MLYRDGLVTRAHLNAFIAIQTCKLSEEEQANWTKGLNRQICVELSALLEDEAKKDKKWAARLASVLKYQLRELPRAEQVGK